ncbi:MAG: hemerythrin domain-containing protein [Elusimicrobia bacterium]|nr:hemerythrin domain-containing protein [Elusimicrobiota bacterium]
MNVLDKLLEDHSHQRRLAGKMTAALGPPAGEVGWQDCASCDLEGFKKAHRELKEHVLDHERREELFLAEAISLLENAQELEAELAKAHESVNHLLGLMETVTALYDGVHLHSLRTVAERLKDELESHHDYEEKKLFSRLRRTLPPADLERLSRRVERAREAEKAGKSGP